MNCAAEIIRQEIQREGPISFARFMELALYAPEVGYYEQKKEIGQRGDFYTSVSVGPLFGELLAFQFVEWLMLADPAENALQEDFSFVQIVEAGAHDGRLAADILRTMRQWRPDVFRRLQYWILEPSPWHEAWQRQTLAEFENKIRWFKSWSDLPTAGVQGIIFSNELLDAMPVQSLRWDATRKIWLERKVDEQNERFVWQEEALCAKMKSRLPEIFLQTAEHSLGDFQIEISPAAETWWQNAARTLRCGQLLTIDYGFLEAEYRAIQGTLRAYFRHHATDDVLANPGQQDLTAHVNFSAIQRAGEAAGLQTHGVISQAKFLTQIIERGWKSPSHFLEWNAPRTRQFQTLTHPEHLGRSFQVLRQFK